MESTPFDGDRRWALVFGVILITMPAITLVVAFAALRVTQGAIARRLTFPEFVELYFVELVVFATISYVLYRIALLAWVRFDVVGEPTDDGALTESSVTTRTTSANTESADTEANK